MTCCRSSVVARQPVIMHLIESGKLTDGGCHKEAEKVLRKLEEERIDCNDPWHGCSQPRLGISSGA